MPPSEPSADDGPSIPVTPRKQYDRNTSGSTDPTTPTRNSSGAYDANFSDPFPRRRANSKKNEPTLLTDFFLGRQTPARVAADRKRRQSLEAVKAEMQQAMQQEMKQSAVRKLQQPGGVKDRVRNWQKTNAATSAGGNPDYAATEPSDIAFDGEELESVTEEDRVRIKMRLRQNAAAKRYMMQDREDSKSSGVSEATQDDTQSIPPPKKRVVSDSNWMRQKPRRVSQQKLSPSPSGSGSATKSSGSGHQIPSDFTSQSVNPPVSSKIKQWAAKVEAPEDPIPRPYQSSRSRDGRSDYNSKRSNTKRQTPKSKSQPGSRTVTPSKKLDDDGIRVTGSNPSSIVRDDGIRVRPTVTASDISFPGQTYQPPRQRSKSHAADSTTDSKSFVQSEVSEPTSASTARAARQRKSIGANSDAGDKDESTPGTPTKSKGPRITRPRPKSVSSMISKFQENQSQLSDETSMLSSSVRPSSDLASNLTTKTLADIPGDIPFGHSAFSELDLSVGGTGKSRPKRTKVDRNTSLKSMPQVFKKVMEEGKKIIQDMNEPPKQQLPNKPPSIEKWLNGTIDPFVDTPAPKPKASPVKEIPDMVKERPAKGSKTEAKGSSTSHTPTKDDEPKTSKKEVSSKEDIAESVSSKTPTAADEAGETVKSKATAPSASLKRSRATRANSSPLKPSSRREFLGMFKNAFQGESAGFSGPPKTYQSQENRKGDRPADSIVDESVVESSLASESTLSRDTATTITESDLTAPAMAGPRYRPPTTGQHQLSTIMSEQDSSSAVESDLTSDMTHSTITQSTVLTKESDQPAVKLEGPGLKRRLTRHSDLVSVLSLPDNSNIPQGIKNNRSRPSLRKIKGIASDVTADELIKEFVEDENLYVRELKTLVDGVVPVLLSHVVNGSSASDLFGVSVSGPQASSLSKSVVGMGVALEKLKNAHRKAPTSDLRRLTHWAHGIVPIYNNYISSWRLGFQDVVVNLAPAAPGADEDDSLLDALPRNESGDIVGADGERVAVAHLLKRPLVRIKQMTKLLRCADELLKAKDTNDLLRDFENLQDKARRRNRDEVARITDEDAANTDTTRSRDPRTLEATASTIVDSHLQVSAKDIFSLDMTHSNGQRMECSVELIHRDSSKTQAEQGDLLIREVGDGKRTYLLFPPLKLADISARTGDGNFDMVLMIRGTYNGRQWHELVTLYADDEDQILDWLDILPVSPVPPREPEPSVVGDDHEQRTDVPIGVTAVPADRPLSPLFEAPQSPQAPRGRQPHHEPAFKSPQRASPNIGAAKTPTQDIRDTEQWKDVSHPLQENMRPDPLRIKKKSSPEPSYRDDGAPPPPVHRVINSPSPAPLQSSDNSTPVLSPPSDNQASDKLKRRGSSPLKHEYLPSDNSSASEVSSQSESDVDSDDDDLDSMDIPETELGISIAKEAAPKGRDGLMTDSECSLTPSNSASQAGLYASSAPHKVVQDANVTRYMASISRWSDKGVWRDILGQPCSIIITAGLIEAYAFRTTDNRNVHVDDRPLIALDLTPLVLIRQSTALDLEIRSSMQTHSRLYEKFNGGNFRFRCHSAPECFSLYMSVHHARLNNQKFIQLENEARFKSFGEQKNAPDGENGQGGRRRSWFGRKNSYRNSGGRPPSQHQDAASTTPSSTPSASSFLKRLTVAGNGSFNLAKSSVDKHSQPGSGHNSLYTSGSSSSGNSPRSPSISIQNGQQITSMDAENIRIRLHLLVTSAKWEDFGNCILQIRRPPAGWRQALRADHGLEKRVTVTTVPKKESDPPTIVLDAVLGSGCFSAMGSRGIVCGVWEEVKGADGVVGAVPATGATGGNIKKWCFQCASLAEASWVLRLVHQEVLTA